jgi:glycerol-1-phosphate dehydrogenase [NAD(P)+]
MQLPREVIVGSRILPLVGETCRRLGFTQSSLILLGPYTYDIAGKAVVESLQSAGFGVTELIIEKSNVAIVELARKEIRKSKPSVVLGIGGGKVIDVAKLSSAEEGVPFVSVPTAASHDGIASPRASIKDGNESLSVEAHAPVAIIADTSVIIRSPYRLTASGCGDIIAKYTSVRDWRLAHKLKGEYYGEYAASLALMCARLVIRNAELIRRNVEESLRTVLEALISCGVAMGIAGSSRPCSGSEHLFSHALDRLVPTSAFHGEKCGVGAIMMAYLHGANWKLIRDSLRTIGAPTTAKELRIEPKYVIEALTIAHKIRPDRYTILGENGLTHGAAERLALATGVL